MSPRLIDVLGCSKDEFILRYVRDAGQPAPQPMESDVMATLKLGKKESFGDIGNGGAGGSATKYPWAEWFTGDIQVIERHDGPANAKGTIEDSAATTKRDYGVPNDAMKPKVKTAARARYKVCSMTNRVTQDQKDLLLKHFPTLVFVGLRLTDAFVIQARDMTTEERAKEDELRKSEKEVFKATKEVREKLKHAKDMLALAKENNDEYQIKSAEDNVAVLQAEYDAIKAELQGDEAEETQDELSDETEAA